MAPSMRLLSALGLIWPLLLAASGGAAAASLTDAEQAMLDELLGSGVVGAPVAGGTLTAKFAPLSEGTWIYQIASGENRGQTEQHVVKRLKQDPSGADWHYAIPGQGAVLIDQLDDGSLMFISERDDKQKVITRYEPAEPGLLTGLKPGDSRTSSIAVKVADVGSPDVVSHSGKLEVTYSYLGNYKVATPAGTYDAALIKWTYKGKVGPADVDDTQYRFFAENVGMVATIDKLDVSALFVYHEHSKFGKVLARLPQ
jgi:hypothetical protein